MFLCSCWRLLFFNTVFLSPGQRAGPPAVQLVLGCNSTSVAATGQGAARWAILTSLCLSREGFEAPSSPALDSASRHSSAGERGGGAAFVTRAPVPVTATTASPFGRSPRPRLVLTPLPVSAAGSTPRPVSRPASPSAALRVGSSPWEAQLPPPTAVNTQRKESSGDLKCFSFILRNAVKIDIKGRACCLFFFFSFYCLKYMRF